MTRAIPNKVLHPGSSVSLAAEKVEDRESSSPGRRRLVSVDTGHHHLLLLSCLTCQPARRGSVHLFATLAMVGSAAVSSRESGGARSPPHSSPLLRPSYHLARAQLLPARLLFLKQPVSPDAFVFSHIAPYLHIWCGTQL